MASAIFLLVAVSSVLLIALRLTRRRRAIRAWETAAAVRVMLNAQYRSAVERVRQAAPGSDLSLETKFDPTGSRIVQERVCYLGNPLTPWVQNRVPVHPTDSCGPELLALAAQTMLSFDAGTEDEERAGSAPAVHRDGRKEAVERTVSAAQS
jgi:hypothetical protein